MNRPQSTIQIERLLAYLASGIHSAAEIAGRLGCSQPTVSRLVAGAGDRIVVAGRARARRYARVRSVGGLGGEFPVYSIDSRGDAHVLGTLIAAAQEHFVWHPVEGRDVVFRGLPWFLADLYPDGFVGRAFAHRIHTEFGLPARAQDWSADHVLTALARRGEDLMGNLVVGRESLERYFRMTRETPAPVAEDGLGEEYCRLAEKALSGGPAGSSAGGEQPKFTAVIARDGGAVNVLVKFSPFVDTAEGRRWADLLLCEEIALHTIREHGSVPASISRVVEAGGRTFLEVQRFDRVGLHGRLPIVSLRAVDAEFYGHQDSWCAAADRMTADGRLSQEDASAMRWLSAFSGLIGNNDRHFGNISLVMADDREVFRLAPAYDVLPMVYRPADGTMQSRPLVPPAVDPGCAAEWDSTVACAVRFWERAADDARISPAFRSLCRENLQVTRRLCEGPRLQVW